MARRSVPIYADDDDERLYQLRTQVEVAARKAASERQGAPLRVGDEATDPEYLTEAKAAYDAFVDEAANRAEWWIVETIGHEEFRDLLKSHPPRKIDGEDGKQVTHPDDQEWGVNTETFGKALLLFVDPEDPEIRTVVEPDLDAAVLRKRVKRLAAGDFDKLWKTAYSLNESGASVDPKLSRFSPITSTSSET